jgi:hypothetical protein
MFPLEKNGHKKCPIFNSGKTFGKKKSRKMMRP